MIIPKSFISSLIPRCIRESVLADCVSCATCSEVAAKQMAFERLHTALESERYLLRQLTEEADEAYTLRKALDFARAQIVELQERNFMLLGRVVLAGRRLRKLEAENRALLDKLAMLDKLAEPMKLYSSSRMRQLNSGERRRLRYAD